MAPWGHLVMASAVWWQAAPWDQWTFENGHIDRKWSAHAIRDMFLCFMYTFPCPVFSIKVSGNKSRLWLFYNSIRIPLDWVTIAQWCFVLMLTGAANSSLSFSPLVEWKIISLKMVQRLCLLLFLYQTLLFYIGHLFLFGKSCLVPLELLITPQQSWCYTEANTFGFNSSIAKPRMRAFSFHREHHWSVE